MAAGVSSILAEQRKSPLPKAALVLLPKSLIQPELSEPERLRLLLEELGGTFVKLGQMLALQPDLLPREYCNALFRLLDRISPVSYPAIEEILQHELGRPSSQIFDTFDTRPLASASIGQVHRATLDGKSVAVKVQRPGAAEQFRGDLKLMRLALWWVKRLKLRRFEWLIEPMNELGEWTEEELDYRNEARYMMEMAKGVESGTNPTQRIPEVYPDLLTARVLVAEFLQGPTLLDYLRSVEHRRSQKADVPDHLTARLERQGFDPVQLAKHLIDNFLSQVFVQGMFHADLHPANLLILPNNTVGYIDFGITGELSPYTRRHLISMTLATSRGDLEAMAEAMFQVSNLDDADTRAFERGLRELADGWYEGPDGALRLKQSFTLVMLDMLHLSRSTQVWPERDVVKYIRSSMSIDGLIQRFAPELDLSDYLATACLRHLHRHALEQRGSARHWVAWSTSSARLLLDGPSRAGRLLRRATRRGGTTAGTRSISSPPPSSAAGAHGPGSFLGPTSTAKDTMLTGFVVLALGSSMVVGPSSDLGFNLFTAQAVLVAAGLWKGLPTVWAEIRSGLKETPLA